MHTTRLMKMKSQPLHAETNRKCQKLEHEKWLIKHPQPGEQPLNVIFAHALILAMHAACHIPPRPPFHQQFHPFTFHDILKNPSLEFKTYRSNSTRKYKDQLAMFATAYPKLGSLTCTRSTLICRSSIYTVLLQCLNSSPFIHLISVQMYCQL